MLDSWLNLNPDLTFDLLAADDPPYGSLVGAGAYVLLRVDEGAFEYPNGSFRTYYVGESGRSHRRIAEHRQYALRVREGLRQHGRVQGYWYARYGLAARFGAQVLWFRAGSDPRACKHLETMIADQFYRAAGSLPIANGRWPSQWPRPASQ